MAGYENLIVDVEASISKAYDADLPVIEQRKVRQHLTRTLMALAEPNTLIAQIKDALSVMNGREVNKLPWFQRPVGMIILTIGTGLAIAGMAKYLGWM